MPNIPNKLFHYFKYKKNLVESPTTYCVNWYGEMYVVMMDGDKVGYVEILTNLQYHEFRYRMDFPFRPDFIRLFPRLIQHYSSYID